jgi:hypothetical protein
MTGDGSTGPLRWRKKPVVIEAMQWDGLIESIRAICEWANVPGEDPNVDYCTVADVVVEDVLCHTLEGPLNVSPDDWIIKGVQGEFYPCKPDIFAATYEAAS